MAIPVERRFETSFREGDSSQPGLIQEDDGSVWIVKPDGSRTSLTDPDAPAIDTAGSLTVDEWVSAHDLSTGRWLKLAAAIGPENDDIVAGECYLYFDQYEGALYIKGKLNTGSLFSHKLAVVA